MPVTNGTVMWAMFSDAAAEFVDKCVNHVTANCWSFVQRGVQAAVSLEVGVTAKSNLKKLATVLCRVINGRVTMLDVTNKYLIDNDCIQDVVCLLLDCETARLVKIVDIFVDSCNYIKIN